MGISLEGKTAVVTCTPQGMGRVIAQRFLDAGARVMLADGRERGDEIKLDGDPDRHARLQYVSADRLSIANLIAATVDRFGRIDILVNGAPAAGSPGSFLDLETDEFDGAIGGNVRSVFQLSQAVARRMIQQHSDAGEGPAGAIVNISSIAARRTVPELLSYSVTCAALDQLTRSMAASLAPEAIRVNAVALGGVLTERLREALRENGDLREDMIRVTPMGRLAEMDEAAEAALFLASDHAGFITGQIVSVDGGRTLLDPLASPIR